MIYKPPMNIAKRDMVTRHVFLAGSIEMGKAEDWQAHMTEFFNLHNWGVFNPRRDDWDASWVQDFENPQFAQQVNWELNALDNSDFILMYFVPETISPISLYELGRYSESGKMAVVCPSGYWRKGNVEIGCHKDGIPLFEDLAAFKKYFVNKFHK
jgi:hypothetical protein